MNAFLDLQVDNGDDIIISDDDMDLDLNPLNTLLRIAERRISARADDFIYSSCGAGLEQFIQKRINNDTKADIETAIRTALYSDGLLLPGEYDVNVIDSGNNKLMILVSLKIPGYKDNPDVTTFKVMVNLENQRSLK